MPVLQVWKLRKNFLNMGYTSKPSLLPLRNHQTIFNGILTFPFKAEFVMKDELLIQAATNGKTDIVEWLLAEQKQR